MSEELEKRTLDALKAVNERLHQMEIRLDRMAGKKTLQPLKFPGFEIVFYSVASDGSPQVSDRSAERTNNDHMVLVPLGATFVLQFYDLDGKPSAPPFEGYDNPTPVTLGQITNVKIQGKHKKYGTYKYSISIAPRMDDKIHRGDGDPEIIVDGD
jgi:hypothetical protein